MLLITGTRPFGRMKKSRIVYSTFRLKSANFFIFFPPSLLPSVFRPDRRQEQIEYSIFFNVRIEYNVQKTSA